MSEIHPFVRHLYDLAAEEDRGALADLRKGLLNPLRALRHIVPFLRPEASRWEEEAFLLVGGLFGMHPKPGPLSLATALRRLSGESDSVELRFRALLDADPEDLGIHLRHAVALVGGHELRIDYDDLLRKVRGWHHEDKWTQRAWARDYWGTTQSTSTDEEATP